jgi:hypothetical protein
MLKKKHKELEWCSLKFDYGALPPKFAMGYVNFKNSKLKAAIATGFINHVSNDHFPFPRGDSSRCHLQSRL